jgi:prepilin-type N-terminal cleavage/methylation domain-containing protein
MIQRNTIARGFTLIELMIVIAIIGLLASVVLASLTAAKGKANIAKRLESAKQVENALEVYYINNNRLYPSTCSVPAASCTVTAAGAGADWRSMCTSWGPVTAWIPGLVPTYLAALPIDPDMTNPNQCCYLYKSNGTNYKFRFGYGCSAKIPSATYGSYPRYIDPTLDGVNNNVQDWDGSYTLTDWAIYSSGAGGWI